MQYKEQIHNYVQNHKDEIVETLKELIKIPSVRSEAEENAPFGEECARVLKFTQESPYLRVMKSEKCLDTLTVCLK